MTDAVTGATAHCACIRVPSGSSKWTAPVALVSRPGFGPEREAGRRAGGLGRR